MSELRQSPVYYGWVLLVVLGMTTIISYGTTQYLFGVLVVPVSATFHWDRASLSGAYSLGLIIAGGLGVPVGHLVDRWGARLLMTLGSALGGLSLIGLARVHSLFAFSALWSPGLGVAMALTFYPISFPGFDRMGLRSRHRCQHCRGWGLPVFPVGWS
jgi:MFS family permease